jgi:glycine oxidase
MAAKAATVPKDAPRVAVVGAGICGLGIAWRLAAAGAEVEVFDRGAAGRGATWAAAGMLAAGVEAEPGEEALLPLTLLGRETWPAFAADLEAASGIDVGYRSEGTLVVAPTRDDAARLRATYDYQKGLGLDHEWLTPAEARRREPYLGPNLAGAVFSAKDHQVDNRAVGRALRAAFLAAGGSLHEGRVVVLAAGAHSPDLPGLPEAARPPVRPVKGQMLALDMPPDSPILTHVVWGPGLYLVPRLSGRLLVGATVEEKGYDESITAGGVFSLLEAAWRALPAIEELPIAETWVGFRPTSRDDAPILGPTSLDGLFVATGHHRNGILLAPVTADLVSRAILTGALPEPLRPFTIDRFDPARIAGAA